MGRGNAICPDTSSRSHSIAVESQNPGTAYHKVFPARTSSAIFSTNKATNKADVLNCCGKMPSLRRAGLPGSFNLPIQFGTVQRAPLAHQGRFVFRLRMTRAPPTSRSGTWPTHFRPLRWPLTTLLLPPATRHSPLFQAVSVRSIRGEPGRSANRQAFPSSPYPAISHGLQDRQIERISFRVSTNTHPRRFAA